MKPEDLKVLWTIEQEHAQCPDLIGTTVKIQIEKVNPMLSRVVITPHSARADDSRFKAVFGKMKPAVVMIEGDMLMCAMGILARKNP